MASFIRKIIDRSQSRSKSPVKYPINGSTSQGGRRNYPPPHHRQQHTYQMDAGPTHHYPPEMASYAGEYHGGDHRHFAGYYSDTVYASPPRSRKHRSRPHTQQHQHPHFHHEMHSANGPWMDASEAHHEHHYFQNFASRPPREESGPIHFLEEMAANEHQHQQRLAVPTQTSLPRTPPPHHHHLQQLIAPELFTPNSALTTPIMKTASARFIHPATNKANISNEYLTLNGTDHAWARHSLMAFPGNVNAGPSAVGGGGGRGDVHGQAIEEEGGGIVEVAVKKRSLSARPRSTSPRKSGQPITTNAEERRHRSKSPYMPPSNKKCSLRANLETIDYLHARCKTEGCSAAINVEERRFLVCRHQLSHASDFFRTLFLNNRALPMNGVRQLDGNEYSIAVSGLRSPPQSKQFHWFLESTIPTPFLKDVTDGTLETLMRLSRRFASRGLSHRCAKYIQENVEGKPPLTALCWLNWAVKHRFDRATHDKCMPVVARLSLADLEAHRLMMTESTLSDLLAMKLRACYQQVVKKEGAGLLKTPSHTSPTFQTVKVFRTIHKIDHFVVMMEKCPACGRFREHGKIRVLANPCNKMIGCERCMLEIGCEVERKSQDDYQAFYQCEHGLWAFGEKTEDCHCQASLYVYPRGERSVTNDTVTTTEKRPAAPHNSLHIGSSGIPIITTPSGHASTSGRDSRRGGGEAPPRVALQSADELSDAVSDN